jgi:hypothetical protein
LSVFGYLLPEMQGICGTFSSARSVHIRPEKGTVGDFALHVQCLWRFVANDRVLTASADYYEPTVAGEEVTPGDRQSGNLQRDRPEGIFRTYDAETRSLINETDLLTVISLHTDRLADSSWNCQADSGCKCFQTGPVPKTGSSFHPETMRLISFNKDDQ